MVKKLFYTFLGRTFLSLCCSLNLFLVQQNSYGQVVMFDDFNYNNSSDPAIASFNKWSVVDGLNGPPSNAMYSKNNIEFINDPLVSGNKLMTLKTTVNGTSKATTHARIETSGYEYFEGTYAARVYFDETPFTYKDANIQTFYTIVSYLLGTDGSKYSEIDFEYMACDKWGTSADKQVMYLTSWNRYIADPWQAWKNYYTSVKSWQGWHTCVVSATNKKDVKFWLDGVYIGALSITDNDGSSVYPRSPMQVAFANWIWNNVTGSSTTNRNTTMQVDWTLFIKDQEKSPAEVDVMVQNYRSQGVQRKNLAGQEFKVATVPPLKGSAGIANSCYTIHGLYVDGLSNKLGNATEENNILNFAKHNGYNYLLLYEMNSILTSNTKKNQLAAFIKKAKTIFAIDQIAGITENAALGLSMIDYNAGKPFEERLDVINFEFEFWSTNLSGLGYCSYLQSYGACNRTNAFNFILNQINQIEQATQNLPIETEIYIGWTNEAEAIALANSIDRVLLHYYRPNDIDIVQYGVERLIGLSKGTKKVKIAPIFSSEGTGNTADVPFMGDWLLTNPIDKAFESWIQGYNSLTNFSKNNLQVMGATWFTFGRFNQNFTNHISQQPSSQTACIGQTKTFTVQSSANIKKFYWEKNGVCISNGGNISGATTNSLTISSISASDTGTYVCRVVSYDSSNPSSWATPNSTLTLTQNCTTRSPYSGSPQTIPGIVQSENYDLGGTSVAYYDLTNANEGGAYRSDAVDIESTVGGGFNVGYILPGEWMLYTVQVSPAVYQLSARVASIYSGKSFQIELDGINLATVQVPNTAGWQSWQEVVVPNISIPAGGLKTLKFSTYSGDFNLDRLTFTTQTNNQIPTVAITSPTNNSIYTVPAVITISANAVDVDGSIAKVEFYQGNIKLGEDQSAPYSWTWNNVSAGNYLVSAKAIDNLGATNTSSTIAFTVNNVTSSKCQNIQTFQNGGNYTSGSKVQYNGNLYTCKPWPYSGWCSVGGWAYTPGLGQYWQDAWDYNGPCSSSAKYGTDDSNEGNMWKVQCTPNPTSDVFRISFYLNESKEINMDLFQENGIKVQTIHHGFLNSGFHEMTVHTSSLVGGLYLVRIQNDQQIISEKILLLK